MKKIFVFLFMFVFLISLTSAWEFDNVKDYDADKREVTVTNLFGAGDNLITARLVSDNDVLVFAGNRKIAEYEISHIDNSGTFDDVFSKVDLYNRKTGARFDKFFTYKYRLETQKEILVDNPICTPTGEFTGNGTSIDNCVKNLVLKIIPQVEWIEIKDIQDLPPGKIRVGLFIDVKRGERGEWIPTFFGEEVEEWASWTEAIGVDLLHYFTFNETSAPTIDRVDGSHNSTASFGAGMGSAGILNNSWNVSIGESINWTEQTLTGNYSINLWVNADTTGTFRLPVGTTDKPSYWGKHTDGRFQVKFDDSTTINVATGTAFLIDQWEMWTMTYNGTTATFYVNGSDVGNNEVGTGKDFTWTGFGRAFAGTLDWNGSVDEMGIWNTTLTADHVEALYNNGSALEFAQTNISDIDVILDLPANDTSVLNLTRIFNATFDPSQTANMSNATLFIWLNNGALNQTITNNVTGVSSNSTSFTANIPIGALTWNVRVQGTNEFNNTLISKFGTNRTLNSGFIFNSETHSDPVSELADTTFTLNVTLASDLVSIDGVLIYNNSRFGATSSASGDDTIYTRIVTAPSVIVDTNISFTWELTLKRGGNEFVTNITNGLQQVNNFRIDNCSIETVLILNYTMRDEDQQHILNTSTNNTIINIEANFSSTGGSHLFSQQYNRTIPAQVCIASELINNSEYRLDTVVSYITDGYVQEFHHLQNVTINISTIPQNINLFSLLTSKSQEFLFTFKDENFLPVDEALINIKRNYIEEGTSKSVEVPKTDSNGQTLGHLVLGDVIYDFEVTKNGVVLGNFNNKRAVCEDQATGDCKINLNVFTVSPDLDDFNTFRNVNYLLTFDEATRTVSVTFTTRDGSVVTGLLNTTKFDGYQNNTLCSTSLVTSSGTINCVIPESEGNVTGVSQFFINSNFVDSLIVSIKEFSADIFGGTRIILILLLLTSLPFMMISSPIGIVIGAIFGMGIAILLNIVEGGSLIGASSTILWFVVAGMILIWQINRRKSL